MILMDKIKNKDHRQIGQELDLFSFHDVAPGAVFWHPKGWLIYQEIVGLLRSTLNKTNYQEIKTPVMVKNALFKRSGHWQHFGQDNMFNLAIYEDQEIAQGKVPMIKVGNVSIPEVNYSLKPMNCPESTLIYNSRTRSYKDLPLKFSQFDILHRRELSGVLGGLFRLREFSIDDAHIYCRKDQINDVVSELLGQIQNFYKLFNFKLNFFLSTKPDKALELPQYPNLWEEAESGLKSALESKKIKFDIKEKGGAFYGPKVDFHMTDSQGRDWQLATIQLDFQMPILLGCTYVNQKGDNENATIIHRAFTGSIERFIGILTEHYQGAFPLWLSPVQVMIIPIADRHNEYASSIVQTIKLKGIRVELDTRPERLQAKIRDASLQKVPYLGIIGDREVESSKLKVENGKISIRTRKGKDLGQLKLSDFINRLKEEIDKKI